MSTIPILAVIDCASIINSPSLARGTLSAPTSLGSYTSSDAYAYMIASASYVYNSPYDSGNTKSELQINAQVGDTVRWVITSIDRGLQYNTVLQGIGIASASAVEANQITTPVSSIQTFKEFTGPPQSYEPVDPDSVTYQDYVFEASILGDNSGNAIQYNVQFYIADNSGNILGYYFWDPFIKVIN